MNILCRHLFEYLCSILLGIYLGVELLGHVATLLYLSRNWQTGFRAAALFDIPTSSVQASQVVLSGKEPICQCKRVKKHRFSPWVEKIPWRRKRKPTPVLLPGKAHGQRRLVGYSPWGLKKWDITKRVHFHLITFAMALSPSTVSFISEIIFFFNISLGSVNFNFISLDFAPFVFWIHKFLMYRVNFYLYIYVKSNNILYVVIYLLMVGMLCYDFFVLWLDDQLKYLDSHFLLSIYSSCL